MAKNIELVKKVLSQIESGDIQGAGANLSDDFTFSGPVPEPVKKQQYLDFHKVLINAIPDWKFNLTNLQEKGNKVLMKVHITGTNTGTLNLPMLGLKAVPPTGKCMALPEEASEAVIQGDKIVSFTSAKVPGGGVMGILQQLGIPLPAPLGV